MEPERDDDRRQDEPKPLQSEHDEGGGGKDDVLDMHAR